MSEEQVLKKMNEIYSQIDKRRKDKTNCQFRNKDGDRYCRATTNTSCSRCRFFTPTVFSRMKVLVKEIMALEDENEKLKAEVEDLSERVAILQSMNLTE